MKTRLPKTLLLAVLAAASVNSVAYAVHGDYTVDAEDIVAIATDTNYSSLTEAQKAVLLQSNMTDSTNEAPKAIVKNGNGTLTVDENITLNNPLIVTEGTLKINNDVTVTANVKSPSSFISNLSVGGKNAKLVVDGGSYIQTIETSGNSCSPIAFGTTDGSAAVELTNGATVHSDHYIFAGYGQIKDGDGNIRNCGGYTAGTGYEGGDTGRTSILVNNSELSAGTSFQFADVDITVTNDGILKDNTRGLANEASSDPGSWFGCGIDSSTVINVETGSRLELNWLFESSIYENSSTTINISGEGSTLKIADVAHLSTDATGTTSINITDGATATINEVIVGEAGEATVSVGAGSSAEVKAMTVGVAGEIVVGGSMSIADSLTLSDGAVITLEISDLSGKMPSLTLDGTKEGDAVFQLLFTSEALAQMNEGMELDIDAMLKDVDTDILADDTTVMLTLADDVHANVKDIFSATSYTTGSGSSITVVGTIAVPEPTTATLSLLALAGLCARRRRASL